MHRYRTVLSSFVCPSNSWTALRFRVLWQISEALAVSVLARVFKGMVRIESIFGARERAGEQRRLKVRRH